MLFGLRLPEDCGREMSRATRLAARVVALRTAFRASRLPRWPDVVRRVLNVIVATGVCGLETQLASHPRSRRSHGFILRS